MNRSFGVGTGGPNLVANIGDDVRDASLHPKSWQGTSHPAKPETSPRASGTHQCADRLARA